jgi:hypothetical protein
VIISTGVPYTLALAASNTPTSWALASGSIPTGLAFNTSTGAITGTPTTAAADTAFTATVTATNGDGTSTAETLRLWVLGGVAGLGADTLAFPLDWDLVTGKLSVPGITEYAPAGQPPGGDGESPPIFSLTSTDRRVISLGLMMGGVLREPDDIEVINLVLGRRDEEPGILTLTSGAYTVTGADDTARHEVAAYLDADTLTAWLEEGESGPDGAYVDLLLEAFLEIPLDAREFSATATSAIASFAQGETKNHTFSVTLSETLATADYRITAELLAPTQPAFVGLIDLDLVVTYSGGTYTATLASGESVPESESLVISGDAWDITFSVQSVTGDAGGFDVAVRAVATSYIRYTIGPVTVTDFAASIADAGGMKLMTTSAVTLLLRNGVGTTVGTLSLAGSTNYSSDDLETLIEAEIGASLDIIVSMDDAPDQITIYLPGSTTVRDLHYAAGPDTWNAASGAHPSSQTYTDMSFKLTSIGLEMADTGTRFRSQRAPIRVFAPLA